MCRRRGEPGAGDVDERAPVGEAPELDRAAAARRWRRARTPPRGRAAAPRRGRSRWRCPSGSPPAARRGGRRARRSEPIVPSPPATATARAPSAATPSRSSGSHPQARTSAPWRRIVSASGSGSRPPPEAALAISAMRTRRRGYRRRAIRLRAMFGRIDHVGLAVSDLEEAIDLHVNVYGLALVHRETVAEQGVEAALLDVGENHVELLAPLHDDTPVGALPRQARPRAAPRGLPGGGHRGHAADPARRRAAADRRVAANRASAAPRSPSCTRPPRAGC